MTIKFFFSVLRPVFLSHPVMCLRNWEAAQTKVHEGNFSINSNPVAARGIGSGEGLGSGSSTKIELNLDTEAGRLSTHSSNVHLANYWCCGVSVQKINLITQIICLLMGAHRIIIMNICVLTK